MNASTLLFLLILACPLMMVFMMRGHGGHSHSHGSDGGSHHDDGQQSKESLWELRRRRAELDSLEQCEPEGAEKAPLFAGRGR